MPPIQGRSQTFSVHLPSSQVQLWCATDIGRASDVWYLASAVHTMEYGPETAVVWLLWKPKFLILTF